MKKINILYWIFTGLFAAFMVFASIGNVMVDSASLDLLSKQLGYPTYIIPFLGVAKILGVIAILIPGFPRIKEWAYAGLFFDLIGATYSLIAISGIQLQMAPMLVPFILGILSYLYYHKRLSAAVV